MDGAARAGQVAVSEVDVAFRRAQAALQQRQVRLSGQEWARDQAHRRRCRRGGVECEDVAHHYGQALADGRVYVDSVQVGGVGDGLPETADGGRA